MPSSGSSLQALQCFSKHWLKSVRSTLHHGKSLARTGSAAALKNQAFTEQTLNMSKKIVAPPAECGTRGGCYSESPARNIYDRWCLECVQELPDCDRALSPVDDSAEVHSRAILRVSDASKLMCRSSMMSMRVLLLRFFCFSCLGAVGSQYVFVRGAPSGWWRRLRVMLMCSPDLRVDRNRVDAGFLEALSKMFVFKGQRSDRPQRLSAPCAVLRALR